MVRVTEASGAEQQRVVDRNLILFPAYWDAKRTVAKGRRVPVELASEYVTLQDVAECLTMLGLPLGLQKKAYCRDVLTQAVRLRVPLRNEMGILINPQIDSRKTLYTAIGKLLKDHPPRLQRVAFIKQQATPTGQLANCPPSLYAVALVPAPGQPPGQDGAGPSGGGPTLPDKKKGKGKK